jgi:hypothetical protein
VQQDQVLRVFVGCKEVTFRDVNYPVEPEVHNSGF